MPLIYEVTGVEHADTDLHSLDLKAVVPEGTVAVIVKAGRTSGSGSIDFFPIGDVTHVGMRGQTQTSSHTVALKDRKLYYKLTNANDVFKVTFHGAWVNLFD